jgi:hypothetical protein
MIRPIHNFYPPKKLDLNNSANSVLLLSFAFLGGILFKPVQKPSDWFAFRPTQ